MMPSPDPVSPGDTIGGKYRVDRVLGRGGMGVVVAATHAHLGQRVAIKFLLREAMVDEAVVQRFLREGRTMVQLQSEHVARVTDVGTHDNGTPYLVMEFLQGVDLGEHLRARGVLSPVEAVEYLLQACEAVAEAHALKVVHRDLKPSNLFLTRRPDGSPLVKVLDFGISKAHEPSGMALTVTSAVMGSPAYMSPEQVRSTHHVDQRSDVWALGVILYELLSGALPFEATTMSAMFAAIVASPLIPIRDRRPDLPPELAAAVERALAKEPAARFQSVAELAVAIAPFGGEGARVSMQRITRLLGTSGTALPPLSGEGSALGVSGVGASTTGPVVGTTGTGGSRGLVVALLALVALLFVVLGAVALYAFRGSGEDAAAESAAPPPPTVAPASAAPPPAARSAPAAAAPQPSAASTASAVPSLTPAAQASAAVAPPKRVVRPAKTAKPSAAKPVKGTGAFNPLDDGR